MSENEKETRKKRIDKKLKDAGWIIIANKDVNNYSYLEYHAVEEYPTDTGPADYALFVKGNLLGFVEAKKVSVGVSNVLEQAKRYSLGANETIGLWDIYKTPFLYSSNGEVVYFLDVKNELNISRQIQHFHTPFALEEFLIGMTK
ncbi:hypothetical protein WQ54_19410 [Bacillus sp. SA1-12]|uniref:type I restriction endonuclease n=1 Tax=Bacillus sp. SA1-12 TaxID=1455638 RepID=UPI00062708E4|nr:type I restriction endonuclease [Bacillus sp. SA1-12]KKI90689.1 hypothetical protein WQ54_19410 [Bacillus sp. SA1-12]